jgi:hypothetical protein
LTSARAALNRPDGTFEEETRLVVLMDSLVREAGRDAEAVAELSLLRLRAIERVIADSAVRNVNPYSQAGRVAPPEAVNAWLEAHRDQIAYSEPAGEWLVPADAIWDLHDRYRRTAFSDEIAWAAANAGLPGECEGFAGCYLDGMLRTHVRYLETHPDGAYVTEALHQLAALLQEIDETDRSRPLCGDDPEAVGVSPAQLERIRDMLHRLPADAGGARTTAERALDRLELRCQSET